jgi:formate dehydrogenase iron-sulfur subunit
MSVLYPADVPERARQITESILGGPIPDEAELTAGARVDPGRTYGFFTDSTLCIGCKACEVACKEWNLLPADHLGLTGHSYDNTSQLSATTWRHVAFVEQNQNSWLMLSDVCKHCARAACLEACPTGALFRTEFGTVVVQQDICNGCGYCVPACPFGVVELDLNDGKAHKCTLCYDRLKGGLEPACAKACPTNSIQFGPLDELEARARRRVDVLHQQGVPNAFLYGAPEAPGGPPLPLGEGWGEGSPGATGGIRDLHAFFLLTERPEIYNLPAAPTLPSKRVAPGLLAGLATVAGVALAAAAAFGAGGRRG